jgi:predicted glycosyltransferase
MTLRHLFYHVKPLVPRLFQIAARRQIAFYKKKANCGSWPIHPDSGKPPDGWTGWPDQKRFALVLSHDVDTARGHDQSRKLMELDNRFGFKSSFNFVPEGYEVSPTLRQYLKESGFDVGVHGLNHDGKIFSSRAIFDRRAPRINYYLRQWGAAGFCSPSMQHNLDWISDLEIEYDCSTFDTDPFEPQPDGVKTIFPFIISKSSKKRVIVELPLTLPQDHCLFVILKEKDISIWKEKLDWIAQKGGMAFLNTHPDYMNFEKSKCSLEEYPAEYYVALLKYIKSRYAGQYWNVLPREIAQLWKKSFSSEINLSETGSTETVSSAKSHLASQKIEPASPSAKIWIDLDNTPHVPLFIPIIKELERRGHRVILTARDAYQVCELADEKGVQYIKIGRHYGKNPIMKVIGLLWRSAQLAPFCMRQKPDLALSHGSRSQILLCNFLRIPTILMTDYEHTQTIPFAHPRWKIVPDSLCRESPPSEADHIRCYHGIKEDVYAPEFTPDPSILEELGVRGDELIVTIRPPANEAHYYTPESDTLLFELMARISRTPGVQAILLPRNHHQEKDFRVNHPNWFANGKTVVPSRAVDGLNLLWYSDFVVSGGGTMNREIGRAHV